MSTVTDKTALIRSATFGKDVREALASGIEAIDNDQNVLSGQFNSLVINAGSSNAEIVAGRTSVVTGLTKDTIGHRIDDVDSSLAQNATQLTTKLTKADIQSLIGFLDINKNLSQIDATMLTPALLAQIAGTAGVNVTPLALSVLTNMYAGLSVTPEKTNFFKLNGKNIYNIAARTEGYALTIATGVLTVSSTFAVTDYIKVNYNTSYTSKYGVWNAVYYDGNKNYISGANPNGTLISVPNTSTIVYMRVDGGKANFAMSDAQIEKGTVSTTYQDYNSYYRGTLDLSDNIVNSSISDIRDELQLYKIINTANLFDLNRVTQGYSINSDGSIVVNASFATSFFMNVDASSNYITSQQIWTVAYYDKNKIFLSYSTGAGIITFTTPINCAYVRVSAGYTNLSNQFMLAKNSLPSIYTLPYKLNSSVVVDSIVNKPYANKKYLFMGDSITALTGTRGWWTYFNQFLSTNSYNNVAVSGAHWCDYPTTTYDGNPVFNGADNNINNVMGNQVQKVLNNNYDAPDVIIMCAGTNDVGTSTDVTTIEQEFTSSGSYTALNTANRQNFAGAIRYCVETLQTKYPNAQIFISTPIQGAESTRSYVNIKNQGTMISAISNRLSIPVINTFECGIYGKYEINGSNGKYLLDGLHPNDAGASKMGNYIATKVIGYINH